MFGRERMPGSRAPLRIAAIYFVLGFLWILFSDHLVMIFTETPTEFLWLQTLKGWFYVLGTAVMVWILVRNFAHRQMKVQAELRDHRDEIAHSLQEKETLLREVHHRVKNNLQVMLSIINLTAQDTEDTTAVDPVKKISNRIYTISLAHEHMLVSRDREEVECERYFSALFRAVTGRLGNSRITVSNEIAPCRLPVRLAVPCGLVANEILTNALQHAFPDNSSGTVALTVSNNNGSAAEGDFLEISVVDDGVGIENGKPLNGAGTASLGLSIARAMAVQASGDLTVRRRSDGTPGTEAILRVPLSYVES